MDIVIIVSMVVIGAMVILAISYHDSEYNAEKVILKQKVIDKISKGELDGIDLILDKTHNEALKRYLLGL